MMSWLRWKLTHMIQLMGDMMEESTKEAIDELLLLDKKCAIAGDSIIDELSDKYYQQVRVVMYNLACELYDGKDVEELLRSVFRPDKKEGE